MTGSLERLGETAEVHDELGHIGWLPDPLREHVLLGKSVDVLADSDASTGVSMVPGQMHVTRIPSDPRSRASTPPFDDP